jgi:hypothetical protein
MDVLKKGLDGIERIVKKHAGKGDAEKHGPDMVDRTGQGQHP